MTLTRIGDMWRCQYVENGRIRYRYLSGTITEAAAELAAKAIELYPGDVEKRAQYMEEHDANRANGQSSGRAQGPAAQSGEQATAAAQGVTGDATIPGAA